MPSAHGRRLAERVGCAPLWLSAEDGHVSVLGAAPAALAWLCAQLAPPRTG